MLDICTNKIQDSAAGSAARVWQRKDRDPGRDCFSSFAEGGRVSLFVHASTGAVPLSYSISLQSLRGNDRIERINLGLRLHFGT